MTDQGSGPANPPGEGPNPFSREGAAGPAPDAAGPRSPGAPPPSQPDPSHQPSPPYPPTPYQPPHQPEASHPPVQPEPPNQAGGYGQPAGYGDPGYGQAAHAQPGYPSAPYLPAGYGGYGGGPVDHPQATPALVTGIIGLVLGLACGVGGLTGIAGLVLGGRAKRDIDADPARWTGRSKAQAGVVTGVIGLVMLVLWAIVFVTLILA